MDQGKKEGKFRRKGTGKQIRNKTQTRRNEGINGRIKEDRNKEIREGRGRKYS